jgi:hypothetical protein
MTNSGLAWLPPPSKVGSHDETLSLLLVHRDCQNNTGSRICSRYMACGDMSHFQVGGEPSCSLPWEILWNIDRRGRRQHPEVRTPKDNPMLRTICASIHVIRLLVVSSWELVTNSSRSSTYDCWLVGELRRAMVSMVASVRCFFSLSCTIWSCSSEDINSGSCRSSTRLPVIVTLAYPSDTGNKTKTSE